MNKKFLSFFVVSLFAFSVFMMTNADESDGAVHENEFFVNNVDVIAHPENLPLGCTFSDRTLTFNNDVTLDTCHAGTMEAPGSPIWYYPDIAPALTIVVNANVTVDVDASAYSEGQWVGLFSYGNLVITGNGTLTIRDDDNKIMHGIYAHGGLLIESGTYNITVHDGVETSDIYTRYSTFSISGGTANLSRRISGMGEANIIGGEINFSNKPSTTCNIYYDGYGGGYGGLFSISGTAMINLNYNLAADDNVVYAAVNLNTNDAAMSDNLGVDGHYIKATGAGHGWIGANILYVNGELVSGDRITDHWTYTASNNTLTLDGASLTTAHTGTTSSAPIYYGNINATLNIVLAPSSVNSITGIGSEIKCGIYSAGGLNISGSGSLTINNSDYDFGIKVERKIFQMDGGDIDIGVKPCVAGNEISLVGGFVAPGVFDLPAIHI